MKPSLLKRIICVNCKSNLKLNTLKEENKEILEGVLSCKECHKDYFIINGVPRLFPDKLEANFLIKYLDFFSKHNIKISFSSQHSEKNNSSFHLCLLRLLAAHKEVFPGMVMI